MTADPLHRLFVYGTLMRGEANAQLMRPGRFVAEARTVSGYRLAVLQGYPALLAGGAVPVRGELYLVDARHLAALDEFEGHPTLFLRQEVALAGGQLAQAYCWAGPASELRAPLIADGDWRRFRRGRAPGGPSACPG